MANSMLAAVRDAVAGPVEMSSVEDEPRAPGGHAHSQPGGHSMSENDGKPVAKNAGISQAEHDASVEKARGEGHAAGSAEATTRLGDVLGAEGIKGDGGRMAAALDLAAPRQRLPLPRRAGPADVPAAVHLKQRRRRQAQ